MRTDNYVRIGSKMMKLSDIDALSKPLSSFSGSTSSIVDHLGNEVREQRVMINRGEKWYSRSGATDFEEPCGGFLSQSNPGVCQLDIAIT
jgi:hypothetical protein